MTIMELAAIPLWTLGVAGAHYRRPRARPLRVRRRQPVYSGPQPPQDPDLGLGPRYRLGPVPPARQRG